MSFKALPSHLSAHSQPAHSQIVSQHTCGYSGKSVLGSLGLGAQYSEPTLQKYSKNLNVFTVGA